MNLTVLVGGIREVFDIPDEVDIQALGERLHRGSVDESLITIPRREQALDAVLLGSRVAGWWFDDVGDRRGVGFS